MDQILCWPDPTAVGLTGDVTLSVSPLLEAGFLYRDRRLAFWKNRVIVLFTLVTATLF